MDFELADWQRAASDAFADYLAREVAPIVGAHERERRLPPREMVRAMSGYGLLGGLLPEALGGQGLDHVTYGTLLAQLPTASLDRVVGQNVKPWLTESLTARPLHRLQSEMQMLLYNHPVNDAREARRQHTVNSFWLHGAGALPNAAAPPTSSTQRIAVPDTLRASAMRGDVQAWQQAWQTLDATVLADALAHLKSSGQASLSLCSENNAHTYQAIPLAWHQRVARFFNPTTPVTALQALLNP